MNQKAVDKEANINIKKYIKTVKKTKLKSLTKRKGL
jgi:hypothetical protein